MRQAGDFQHQQKNPAAVANSSMPSNWLRGSSIKTKTHNTVTADINGCSRRSNSECATSGWISAAPSRTSKILAMLKPKKFPNARAICPFSAAVI